MKNLTERLKNDIFVDAIPKYSVNLNNEQYSILLEQQNDNYSQNWELFNISRSLLNEENKNTPINLRKAHIVLDILNNWVERNLDVLTYPLTKDSFENAVMKTIDLGDSQVISVLCGAFPNHTNYIVLQHMYKKDYTESLKIKDWFFNSAKNPETGIFYKDQINNKPKVENQKAINNESNKYNKENNYNKKNTNYPSSKTNIQNNQNENNYITKNMEKFINELDKCIENYNKDNVNNNFINTKSTESFLKNYLNNETYFTKDKNINEWVEKVFFPSLYHVKNVNLFLESFPNWRKNSLEMRLFEQHRIDSKSILDNKTIWGFIKQFTNKYPDYENTLINKLLPNVVTIENFTPQERFKFGKKILKPWCDNNEKLFKQRVLIWEKLGGSLFEKNYEKECLASWIRKEKNEKWNKVLDELYPSNKNSFYAEKLLNDQNIKSIDIKEDEYALSMEEIVNTIQEKKTNKFRMK